MAVKLFGEQHWSSRPPRDREDAHLDETIEEVMEHYRTCRTGLAPKVRDARRKLDALAPEIRR